MYYGFNCKFCLGNSLIKPTEDNVVTCPYCGAEFFTKIEEYSLVIISEKKPATTEECESCVFFDYYNTVKITLEAENNLKNVCIACCMLEGNEFSLYCRTHCNKQLISKYFSSTIGVIPDIVEDDYLLKIVCEDIAQVDKAIALLTEKYRENSISYSFKEAKEVSKPNLSDPYQCALSVRKSGNQVEFVYVFGSYEIKARVLSYYVLFYVLSQDMA